MMTLEAIKHALRDRRLSVVSEATGAHYNTLKDIRDGRTTNPKHATVVAVSDYLEGKGCSLDHTSKS